MSLLPVALLDPVRAAVALSHHARDVPRRVLDAVDRDRVRGRRASLRGGRAMVEVRGLAGPDAEFYTRRLVSAIESLPGVAWAGVNGPLGRIVAAVEEPAPPLAELVAVVDAVEHDRLAALAAIGQAAASPPGSAAPVGPPDQGAVDRAALLLVTAGAGLAGAGAGAVLRRTPLPAELSALLGAIEHQPRLRTALEAVVGHRAADLGLATAAALAHGLSGGWSGAAVGVARRVTGMAEAQAARAAWDARADELLATAESVRAEAPVVQRPRPLPSGPVERHADRATVAAPLAFALGWPLTGEARRGLNLALAAVPKAGRTGREGFAATLGTLLARRGAVVLDPAALRLLDRVDTVVLDGDVLVTGRSVIGEVRSQPDAEAGVVATRLHDLFDPDRPAATRTDEDGWTLRPVRDSDGPRVEIDRLVRRGARHLLALTTDERPVAVVSVLAEPVEAVDALAAAAHRAGARLVVAGQVAADTAQRHTVLPGGDDLVDTVRTLQADGGVVLVVSARTRALAHADVGVGVGSVPAWGAQILIGADLELAALLIESCGVAAATSRRATALAQAGSALGAVGVLLEREWGWGRRGGTAGLAVNGAAALALGQGVWAARRLGERPLVPPVSRIPWHIMPVDTVLAEVNGTADGLASAEAQRRRRRGDPAASRRPGLLQATLQELDNPLTPILAGGAALSAAIGSVTDAGLVAGVTAISALAGGVQRLQTERAVAELMSGSAVVARVLRDGRSVQLPAEDLVVGDVVELRPGDVVPADCRVLEVAGLQTDEAALTGEPFPVTKQVSPVLATGIADRASMLYEGTTVSGGRSSAVVVATGGSTEVGRSIAATRRAAPPTGVENRLESITRTTLPIALGSACAVVAGGLLRGRPLREGLEAGVSLAVASVPEGLPFLVNAAQLASARRLSQRGALVRNPRTIEALGRVDTLCFDKTGTLTEGRITLAAVDDTLTTEPIGSRSPRHREVLAAGLRATPVRQGRQQLTHFTDRAVSEGAREAAVTRREGRAQWRRLAVLPFEPSRGLHATLGATGPDDAVLSVKGAPETVLPACTLVRGRGRAARLDARRRRRLLARATTLAEQGYRILAVAERADRRRRRLTDDDITDLTLLGFLALSDPVRPAAAEAVSGLREAGVQIVMITGDHPGTAESVARRLGVLNGGTVVTGPELDDLDDAALDAVLPRVTVVARGTPAHKVRVVQAFQRLERAVAMTGDGANDAPAIRLADVGIALGRRATPAARTAADLVVTDDRLETILAALVEGRSMWASVREALGILVGGNLGEIAFTVLGTAATGISPLSTRQLLLVNLLTDLAPALAIALRAPDAGDRAALLAEGPEASLGDALTRDITRRAATTAAATTAAWTAARFTGPGRRRARTIALTSLVGSQLGQTVAIGGTGPSVLASSLGSAALLAVIVQTPIVSHFFGCTPLGPVGWAISGGAAAGATVATLVAPHRRLGDTEEHPDRHVRAEGVRHATHPGLTATAVD